ncbi:MAG: putative rane protein [Clostridia bacterium]|nr:putative rane protein [Clostridia bacterium]
MMKKAYVQPNRRSVAYVSILGTTQLHLRSPFIIALWSVTFPGLGHLLLSKYLRGFLLFTWEVFVNYKAHINLLILHSFIGDFEKAKSVVDINWMLIYIPTYIFAIWDSYRTAIDLNHHYILAAREDAEIKPFKLSALEINYLDKRKPWVSAAWSALIPGTGQLYIHRIVTASFAIAWWIVVSNFSKLLPIFHYTFTGDFQQAKAVVDMHWFLNIPSIYFFAIYDAYANTVENNKLFDWELSKFLKKDYQDRNFKIPINHIAGDHMYIFSTFEHSKHLELAITAIQMKGINKENILAVPMDKRSENIKLFDSIHGADGVSTLDIAALLAAFFGIFGSIYGFILEWGPLFWGLIGIAIGMALGLIIKFFTSKKYKNRQKCMNNTEVILIVECNENQMEMVKDMLWSHHAFGVSKLDLN